MSLLEGNGVTEFWNGTIRIILDVFDEFAELVKDFVFCTLLVSVEAHLNINRVFDAPIDWDLLFQFIVICGGHCELFSILFLFLKFLLLSRFLQLLSSLQIQLRIQKVEVLQWIVRYRRMGSIMYRCTFLNVAH